MKKKYKMLIVFFIIGISILAISNVTFAFGINDIDNKGSSELEPVGVAIIKVLTTIGMVASIIVLVILGIKYMLGSLEEKAEYKKTLMPYFIGAVCVFGASSIASMIYNVAKDL